LLLPVIMDLLKTLIKLHGELYSHQLGITPRTEPFKWLLAAVLYGAPIQENIAAKTYKEFEKNGIITPERILRTGWDGLVEILDKGGYVRYDFKTADKLLEMAQNIKEKGIPYSEEGIMELGKGIGRTTAAIFLRELRDENIDPEPQKYTFDAAENLGLIEVRTLQELKDVWFGNRIEGYTFMHFETALLKLGKNFCRKERHSECEMKKWCTFASG
jgi:endonuclease III